MCVESPWKPLFASSCLSARDKVWACRNNKFMHTPVTATTVDCYYINIGDVQQNWTCFIVFLLVGRYIAVCRPFRRRIVCTKTFAHRAITMVVLLAAIVSSHKPLLSGVYDIRPRSSANDANKLTAMDGDLHDWFVDVTNITNVRPSPEEDVTSRTKNDTQDGASFLYPLLSDHDSGVETMDDNRVCRHNPAYDGTYLSFTMELVYGLSITAVPFVPITVFNIAILRALLTRDAVTRALSQSAAATEKRVRREFTVLVLVISASLICLSLPYFIVWCFQFIQSRYLTGSLFIATTG